MEGPGLLICSLKIPNEAAKRFHKTLFLIGYLFIPPIYCTYFLFGSPLAFTRPLLQDCAELLVHFQTRLIEKVAVIFYFLDEAQTVGDLSDFVLSHG